MILGSIYVTRLMRKARKMTVLKSGPSKKSSAEEVVQRIVEVAAAELPYAVAAIRRLKKSGQIWGICISEDGEGTESRDSHHQV